MTPPIDGEAAGDGPPALTALAERFVDAAALLEPYPALSAPALTLLCHALRMSAASQAQSRDQAAELPGSWAAFAGNESVRKVLSGFSPAELASLEQSFDLDATAVAGLGDDDRAAKSAALRRFLPLLLDELDFPARSARRARLALRLKLGAAVLIGSLVLAAIAHRTGVFGPLPNLALRKPVAASSFFEPEGIAPGRLVDGNTDDLGFHTTLEDEPWVTIDLQEPRPLWRVVVYNRVSERERALPLVIETSADGVTYTPFAQRFDVFEKWTAEHAPVNARWLRLRVKNRAYFHLNEVEVY